MPGHPVLAGAAGGGSSSCGGTAANSTRRPDESSRTVRMLVTSSGGSLSETRSLPAAGISGRGLLRYQKMSAGGLPLRSRACIAAASGCRLTKRK